MVSQSICAKCGSTKNIVNHHISYLPEVVVKYCKDCDSKERRNPEGRGFRILKAYPQRGMLLVPKDILMELGDLIEIELTPLSSVALLFPYKMPLDIIIGYLDILSRQLQLYLEKETREKVLKE